MSRQWTLWVPAALFITFEVSAQSAWGATKVAPPRVEIDRVDGQTLTFKSWEGGPAAPKPLKVPAALSEIKPIGVLRNSAGGPDYALVSALPCADCGAERAIYLLRADGGDKPQQFVYPGKLFEPGTGNIVFQADAFYGRCLNGKDDVYVVFQREKVDRRRWLQPSVFIAQPSKLYLDEKLIERRMPKLHATQLKVKAKECFEISGINRRTSTKRISLTPKRLQTTPAPGSEDEEEAPPKENQTEQDLPSKD